MKTQIDTILTKKKGLTNDSEYIAAFRDGTVSEILHISNWPHPDEGDYVRIFRSDNLYDIQSKLGSLGLVENF